MIKLSSCSVLLRFSDLLQILLMFQDLIPIRPELYALEDLKIPKTYFPIRLYSLLSYTPLSILFIVVCAAQLKTVFSEGTLQSLFTSLHHEHPGILLNVQRG